MKYYSEKSIGARLQQAEEAIIIGQADLELSDALAERGYTEPQFSDGAGRVATVKSIDAVKREQQGLQVVATAEMEAVARILRISFSTDRRLVRLAVANNPEYIEQLRLRERMSTALSDLTLQTAHFYTKIKEYPEVLSLIQERYNIGPEVFDARLADVATLEESLRKQQQMVGQLRKVTQERREAMDRVDEWMRAFISTARIVFKNDVGSLQKLGIFVRRR